MSKITKLSKKGKADLEDGTANAIDDPTALLLMEILDRTDNITIEHAGDLASQIFQKYGSWEDALAAVRAGEVQFDKTN